MASHPESLAHGAIAKVADDVYCVRGGFKMGPGVVISRTMTLIVAGDGLVVFNAVRLNDETEAELEGIGPVKHLVKLSDSHAVDEPYYAEHYKATVWSIPGADLGGLTADKTFGPDGPIPGGVVVDFGETKGWREAAYLVPQGGGTLITCDAVQNHCDGEGASFGGKIMMSLMGFKGGVLVPPMWRRFQKLKGPALTETLSGLKGLSFENLVTGHGPPIVGGADSIVHAAIDSVCD